MEKSFAKMLQGYQSFRKQYAEGNESVMHQLAHHGQKPEIMVIACCDSRVDPALILQCDPGDLFVVRNVANIVPPYELDNAHHGTSAALEFGVCFLQVKHLILLGHSQCGGIQALLNSDNFTKNDFISNWVSLINKPEQKKQNADELAKLALHQSAQHLLTFPWIKDKVSLNQLKIHLWFFDIGMGKIYTYSDTEGEYQSLQAAD